MCVCVYVRVRARVCVYGTVNSRKFKPQRIQVTVSNPRAMACLDLKIVFESSKPEGLNIIFQIDNLKTLVADKWGQHQWGRCKSNEF